MCVELNTSVPITDQVSSKRPSDSSVLRIRSNRIALKFSILRSSISTSCRICTRVMRRLDRVEGGAPIYFDRWRWRCTESRKEWWRSTFHMLHTWFKRFLSKHVCCKGIMDVQQYYSLFWRYSRKDYYENRLSITTDC